MKKILLLIVSCLAISLYSCKTPTVIDGSNAYTTFETECLGVELDGTQTLRAWGTGKNKGDAIDQAKKNAVRDVIFKGISSGSSECNKRPLIFEVNAQEKYEYYFNAFFADGGEYKKYVDLGDEKRTSRIKASNNTQEAWSVVVRVHRAELKTRLIQDNIIKP